MQVVQKMNVYVNPNYINKLNLKYTYGFMFRYIPVLNCVKHFLGLHFYDEIIIFYNCQLTKPFFYKIIKQTKTVTKTQIIMECINQNQNQNQNQKPFLM